MNDDYALGPVPADRTVSGIRIAVVSIGIIIALPAFMSGAEIGSALGFRRGAMAVVVGGLFLGLIAMATGTVAARTRLTTAMITRLTFGSAGGRIVSALLALTTLGWFGVTAELFGRGVHQVLGQLGWGGLPEPLYVVVGGLLMVVTTIFGFSALQRLSNVTVPLLAVLIAATCWITLRDAHPGALAGGGAAGSTLGDGISAIAGGLSVAVTIFPDFCRFARTAAAARLAAGLTYIVAMPAILLLAMIPSVVTQQRDLILIMTMLGLGAPALALLIVKAWATNAGNLYSASLSAANALSSDRQKAIIIAGGGIGTALAVAGIGQQFIPFLVLLGICIPPIAGIYVADMLWLGGAGRPRVAAPVHYDAFACWAFGVTVAWGAKSGLVTLTAIPAADSMLASAGAFFLLGKIREKRRAG